MEQKKLYRSKTNRIIAGIGGGLGQYFSIDPVLIRLIFVLLVIAGGSGILLYIIAWIIIPEEGAEECCSKEEVKDNVKKAAKEMKDKAETFASEVRKAVHDKKWQEHDHHGSRMGCGLLILAIGAILLVDNVMHIDIWSNFWPLVLIIIGLALIIRTGRK